MRILIAFLASMACALAAVDGTVVNQTTGKPQAGVLITLVQPGAAGMQTLATVRSNAEGKFSVDTRLPPGPILIQAIYQAVQYTVPVPPGSPTTGLAVNVFDATTEPASGKVAEHILVIEPGPNGIQISETFLTQNGTSKTYSDSANGSVRFYVPEAGRDKAQITISAPGGMPITRSPESTKTPGVYKATYPIKPGETRFDVVYALPPGDSLSLRNPDPATPLNLVTPPSVTLSGDGIEAKGQEPRTQAHIYLATAPKFDVTITGTGALNTGDSNAPQEDTGAPEPVVEPARIYAKLPWVLGLTLMILALGGLMLYRKGSA